MVISVMLVFGIQRVHRSKVVPAGKLQGQPAPEFNLTTPDGRAMKLSDFHGKAVLLNFWATWCEPCKVEMPWFVDLQKKYGPQGLQVLGVAMGDTGAKEISDFAKKSGVNYTIVLGKAAVGEQDGGLPSRPSTFPTARESHVVDPV